MNTVGPFTLNPYINSFQGTSANQIPVPITVGRGGLVEVINLSDYVIQLGFQSKGNVTQEASSKVLYKIVADIQGTQMVQLSAPPYFFTQLGSSFTSIQPPSTQAASGQLHNLVWFNVYEEGEIEPYSPVSLLPYSPKRTAVITATSSSAPLILTLPTTLSVFSAPMSICYCTGFDLTADGPGAAVSSTLVISGIQSFDGGSGSLNYTIAQFTGAIFVPLFVRFPAPLVSIITSQAGNPMVFTLGNLNAKVSLNVYYFLI